jgi:competence protein ComEA
MDRLTPWIRRSGVLYIGLALALGCAAWWTSRPHQATTGPPAAGSTASVEVIRPTAAGPVVHIVGEVRRPGVYRMKDGSRAAAAVSRAGGATSRADLTVVNLAARLTDGQQLVIPRRAPAGVAAISGGSPVSGPVSLSSATVEQLDAIDGIGPTIAQHIIDWRTANGGFSSIEQLLEVPGIGDGRLEALRPHVAP